MKPTGFQEQVGRPETGAYAFGGFELDPLRRRVLRPDGSQMELAPRAFNTLQLMLDHPGELLYKDWLLAVLWPGTVVDENNLSQIISSLRRSLGADGRRFILTEARRGFRFACPVARRPPDSGLQETSTGTGPGGRGDSAGEEGRPRIAIVPFSNLDNDPGQDYFVVGMTEEIAAALTRIRSLFVITGRPAAPAKGGDAGWPESAARRLGAQYVLEGSVRKAGSTVRITVRLTDGERNAHIWSERFEGSLQDVFALQDRVALAVAGAIEPSIRQVETRRVVRAPTESLNAYDLYLRAAYLRSALRKESVLEALVLLDRALLLDPDFAPALAQAAGCHSQIYQQGWAIDLEFHRNRGQAMADRALRHCGDDAAVLAQVANALMDLEAQPGSNLDRAHLLIVRAIELNPGLAFAWFIGGLLHLVDGQGQQAIHHLQQAMRLDPVSPLHEVARSHLGLGYLVERRFEEALGLLRRASNLPPRAQLALALASSEVGQLAQAREELRRYEQSTSIPAEAQVERLARQPEQKTWIRAALARIRTPVLHGGDLGPVA